ncbi:MAG: saccharopine dehydrogenase C-terminal domain-containing protein [Crocinitomicaceae bacterium]|nr:saccharopine dehydrogenase C-terminal domain-containing protein [Crocinitomicaceae bacterium]
MKKILILGAGLSASSLIRYLLKHAEENSWQLTIVDKDITLIKEKINGSSFAKAISFNALDPNERRPEISRSDLVISMLPARFHVDVAADCIDLKTNLITPSYVSEEMKCLDAKAKKAGILILNEIGVDPGIDHMSAMKIIDAIKNKGGVLTCFNSFCGGLLEPSSENNPWKYKFTWNPRNVVLAGKGGAAMFIDHGEYKYIPYNKLFSRLDHISIDGYGDFEGYPNRDSLSYRSLYGLDDIATIYRGTLRRPGFCYGWDVFVELGMTDDSYAMEKSNELTPRSFLNAFLPYDASIPVEEKFKRFLREDRAYLYDQFEWLGVFEKDASFGELNASPAMMLQKLLVNKMSLAKDDRDMLVMYHEFEYTLDGIEKRITSSMINIGEDQVYTAMSNTVGLPIAMAAKLILTNKTHLIGVHIPVKPEIYEPLLDELEENGIAFTETEVLI